MKNRILRSPSDLNPSDIRALYDGFDHPIADLDCGQICAPHNPNGKPFCCDICAAVPAGYRSEWQALQSQTDLWHRWRGDECAEDPASAEERSQLEAAIPNGMILLACLGPQACQRSNRLLSCRQFPFFPYVTSDYRFLGLSYDWEFENSCWVISNLAQVSPAYRQEFIQTYDQIFAWFQDEFENYAARSEEMRAIFSEERRRIPLLHRNGGFRLVSPLSERVRRVAAPALPRFRPYR
ncbi:MAG: hypothetical protein RBS68_16030 [Anaerolineales bacterium]|jgi:hypothetical protein|nr:hypothetical protein [Anaerolineales bacterium]